VGSKPSLLLFFGMSLVCAAKARQRIAITEEEILRESDW
jgi:hypothetical protein